MSSPPSPGVPLPANQHRTAHIRQRSDLAITQSNVQMLPFARLTSCQQRCQNRVARIESRREIRHRNADFHGRSVALACQPHQPEFRLDHDIEPWAIAVWSCLAVAGDTGVDQTGVDFAQGGVVEAVFAEGVGDVVFNNHVACAREFMEDRDSFWMRKGEAQ